MHNAYVQGVAQTYTRLKAANAWIKSAPLRAGLTVGGAVALPTAGAIYALDSVDPESEATPNERSIWSGIGGAVTGAAPGYSAFADRAAEGDHLATVAKHVAEDGDLISPSVARAAVSNFVVKSPQYPVRGGAHLDGRDSVFDGTAADVADIVEKPDLERSITDALMNKDVNAAARLRAAEKLEEHVYGAVQRGMRGEQPKPASATPAETLLERLRADKPGITDRDLQRMLHPDRAARMGFDPAVAQEAFVSIGRAPAVDPFADAVAAGAENARHRAAANAQLQKLRERMFTGSKSRHALAEALQRAYG